MSGFLNWYCQAFGYTSCGAMSTFEALVLFGAFACLFATFIQIVRFVTALFLER